MQENQKKFNDFYQDFPKLTNQYSADIWLKYYLQWRVKDQSQFKQMNAELESLGARVVGEMLDLAWQAETNPPQHVAFDPWGKRIDEVKVSPAWDKMADIAAEEGIVACGYERKFDSASRLLQAAKLHLYHPSSALFSCPLAMTDGAAKILEQLGSAEHKNQAFKNLTSRDPKKFWTSGQWMTEKVGGSDVSDSRTVAFPMESAQANGGRKFKLFGAKWFTSSVTSQMALTLARIDGSVAGSRGLSLFYVEMRHPDGSLNGVEVLRLKDKLGTRALPTAELELCGAEAQLLGEPGVGVKNIATMLNITRLYNSVCSVAHMRRALSLWRLYADKRTLFGNQLSRQPLFYETYLNELAKQIAGMVLTFSTAEFLGAEECENGGSGATHAGAKSSSSLNSLMVRMLTPLAKLLTGKYAVSTTSEVLEGFGGAGYVEDTRIPVMMRDAQVFPIWEGPTNVLSLDVLRVLSKSEGWAAFHKNAHEILNHVGSTNEYFAPAQARLHELDTFVTQMMHGSSSGGEALYIASARELAFALAEFYAGIKLLEWSHWASLQNYQHSSQDKESESFSNFNGALGEITKRWWARPKINLHVLDAQRSKKISTLFANGLV